MFRETLSAIALLACAASTACASALPLNHQYSRHKHHKKCPEMNGTFIINQYQLYPENADFDFNACLLYMGSLWNSTVAVYDPSTKKTTVLTFPNITQNPEYHLGGVGMDPHTNLLSAVVDAGVAFNTGGQNISGTNLLLQYDPATQKATYSINLTETTHGTYGGFQDVEFDARGNVYVVGTFPASILRVENNGTKVNEWYKSSQNHTVSGYGGLASTADILLANDNSPGQIVKFDMKQQKGTPTVVPLKPTGNPLTGTDAIYLPPMYYGTVLLVAIDALGVEVLRSKDGLWNEAEDLGLVSNNVTEAQGGTVTAPVQIGERLYMVEEFFADTPVKGMLAGNRTAFPFVDITEKVNQLLKK